jgi:hypothetical protein
MTKTIFVLIFEFGTLEFTWNLVLPCGYALCAMPSLLFFKSILCFPIPRGDLNSFSRLFTDALMMS